MTTTKGSRPRRRGGPRQRQPTAPGGYRLRAHRSRRADGRSENLTVWFEHLGEYFDDVLVTHEYDERAVKATRALLTGAGYWDADFKVWRIHPGYAERLVVTLRDLGYTVIEVITNSAPR
jgi:hypothetical protein